MLGNKKSKWKKLIDTIKSINNITNTTTITNKQLLNSNCLKKPIENYNQMLIF